MANNNIVQIDLDKLDADIADMQKQLELLISTRDWAQSFAARTGSRSPVQEPAKKRGRKPGSKKAAPKEAAPKEAGDMNAAPEAPKKRGRKPGYKKASSAGVKNTGGKSSLGVSDFIIHFLNSNDKVDSGGVIKAFATYTKKSEKQVTGNVANAMSRLKSAGKISNEARVDGKKKGSVWFTVK